MIGQLTRFSLFVMFGVWCAFFPIGCKDKARGSTSGVLVFMQLPEATNVTAALEQKDYEAVMSGLVKARDSASTEAQQTEFAALSRHVREKLFEASNSDPKAAEALQAFRLMTSGR